MTSHAPRVALIIVAYNHAAYLPRTLDAIQRISTPRCQTIVVENGDGSSAAVAQQYASVQVLTPGRNLGFAGGCNYAVAATAADLIVLLNPDLQPRPDFVDQITAPLAEPQVGVVGAKLLYPDGHTLQHVGCTLSHPLALAQQPGYGEIDRGQHNTPRNVTWVTGAAMALRRTTWINLGGIDEAFFPAYYEDADLCLRARAKGWAVRYEPRAVAIHHEASGVGRGSVEYHALYHRNRLRLLFKQHDDRWLLHVWLPAELAHLRSTADDAEIAGLSAAYRFWQATFLGVAAPDDHVTMDQAEQNPPTSHVSELDWTLQQVAAKRTIVPQPLGSRWPVVAQLRRVWNRIATEDYLRPVIQQQNDYNAAVAELATALARQRRTTDAAILCQAVLLAKLLHRHAPSD